MVAPFMGGDQCGEACAATVREYIGKALSPEYFEVSRARLETHMAGRQQL